MKKSEKEARDKLAKSRLRDQYGDVQGFEVTKRGARNVNEVGPETLKHGPLARLLKLPPKRR